MINKANEGLSQKPLLLTNKKRIGNINVEFKKGLPKSRRLPYKRVLPLIGAILKKVAQKMVDCEGGVLMDGLGYFFVWMVPNKDKKIYSKAMVVKKGYYIFKPKQRMYNHHTNGYVYRLMFAPQVLRNNYLCNWSLEGQFSSGLKSKISNNLKKGKKYKMFYTTIRSMRRSARSKQSRNKYITKKYLG